ncbi:integrin alpha-E [Emydura macquarii macquarii]|uniref:integrin alpha-E n=1 Tax=Emydura macquarii macquarii TaxID=1129001 RepID=UPI00352A7807
MAKSYDEYLDVGQTATSGFGAVPSGGGNEQGKGEHELRSVVNANPTSRGSDIVFAAVTPVISFNIDTRKKWITPPTEPLSWPKVLQHSDGHRTWVLVTSLVDDDPNRQPGRLNKCTLAPDGLHCEEVGLIANIRMSKNIQDGGIAVARSTDWILACLQKKRRRAFSITEELNGVCTLLTADFHEEAFLNLGKITETKLNNSNQNNNNNNNKINVTDTDNSISTDNAIGISRAGSNTYNNSRSNQTCKGESGTEIVIVLDGSGSIDPEDFERAKGFISNMMTLFWRKCPEVKFAVVQYGAEIRTEFDLQESCNKSSALFQVHNIMQLGSVTKTASALQHVLDEIFNESHGSVKDAHRMILVMTDGEIFLDPLRLADVMSSPKMATIERYALGVGDVFSKQSALKELQLIASDPDEDYLFKLPDYEALDDFLSVLERSILGTSVASLPEAGSDYGNQNSNNNNNNSGMEDDEDDSSDSGAEIAIVLDGSGSISPADFERAKAFIYNMMERFYEKCFECDFALVQYGFDIRTEFDLRDRNASATLQKVQNITQLCNVTKTASAIQHVLDSIFNESQGSLKNAAKIMVVLTDGDIFLDPMNLTTVINSPKMAGVDRYAIGVGEAFNKSKALNELRLIASDPDESHLFQVTNYSALNGLLSTLQQKIIGIEGTAGDSTEYELAQTGFSAQILDKQHILVGAVGAFDWSGGVLLYDLVTKTAAFLNESKDETKGGRYGYLGYSVAVVNTRHGALYVAGAPRHSMTGKVLVFEKDHLKQTLQGDQTGSYFGSELCSLDVNQDGVTDYLLVGAPLYHIHGEEGRVYVYQLKEENGTFSLAGHLSVQTPSPFARFGFSVASIGDINKDGYEDIAVGAPLEDRLSNPSSFGSIYIYNGVQNGLRSTFSQRIKAAEIAPGLQYFGQSIDGGFDLTGDELIDITVGSFGNVTVLRSRPVVIFKVTMRFTPERILIFHNNSIVTAELCFDMSSPLGAFQQEIRHVSVHYTVDLDMMKKKKRAHFEDQKSTLSQEKPASESACAKLLLYILPCDYDCFSNIILNVSYQLHNTNENMDHPAIMLDRYQEPEAYFQLPYKKDCNNKTFCAANLTLRSQTQKELVVGRTKELTMNISLANSGDDSYMTTVVLKYPRNLQFKKMIPEPSSTVIHCGQPKPSTHLLLSMGCKIGHPIFKKTTAHFSVIWQLDETLFPSRTANITINVTNVNEYSTTLIEEHILDVRHAFTAVLTKPTPVLYVNVSQALPENKEFQFNINGENPFGAEIELQILVPISIQGHRITSMKKVTATQNTTICKIGDDLVSNPKKGSSETELQASKEVRYQCVHCIIMADRENVTVIAELPLVDSQQFLKDRTDLLVIGEITFDRHLYVGLKEENHKAEITVILLKAQYTLPIIIGSSVGGFLLLILIIFILYKCGFFKRNYKNMMEEQLDS